ncbi:MAG TPA: precorrin-8X methylmutase [Firmicutes bacterium]|jgi:precorrin-8X/cobalt-precorrin-8 methylmutase|nr:precorrin-8X methylmutase [Bacillota bacterium]
MLKNIQWIKPAEIEKQSFRIIGELLGMRTFDPWQEPVIKRVIHTTADLEYADSLIFSSNAVQQGIAALKKGFYIVTDTRMAEAGINKKVLSAFGGSVKCFMDRTAIAKKARVLEITRAALCMDKAAVDPRCKIFAIGNAPTALIRLCELMDEGKVRPELVIGVPVGFVNVEEAKELLKLTPVPYIIAAGRKGGSNVAAAIVNALLYMAKDG